MESNIEGLETPSHCIADFSLVPIGSRDVSFAREIADVQLLLQKCHLKHKMTPTGTTVGKANICGKG
ncbi:hypothetical protein EYZ11_008061 [Aspergillus tanneri]|uniref:Thiamine-binding protein domain-containing protein n=1 Tax=Aspergillus tanneri TaxID=1220188 RepID=A0A4S3JBL9_9EURO|nr:hypothetical protein EYZ11_008061 [Aspergillus tanneri]